ncbi:GGDEF domain-containing protein [Abyssibacter profundi]|uniref:Sensor domain-containing diguanylate cyclase n=1 Tax=Abyssibacter profundi TaxID=2182787 RepID=A0A363UJ76_9GAMM|nr:diguanylate cyclase [Abyssibacter profundi]PWN55479.1 hypothetical protein DEH80_11835 [Abyssibacter profundi]
MLDVNVLMRAVQDSADSVVITQVGDGGDHPIVFINHAFARMTGYAEAEVLGRDCRFLNEGLDRQPELDRLRDALASGLHCRVVVENLRKDGSRFWNELSISPVRNPDGRLTHFLGIQHDVTEQLQQQRALETQAVTAGFQLDELASKVYHDHLTELVNRRGFDEALARLWASDSPRDRPFALLRIDVDFFESFNDAHGQTDGDHCLQDVARAIQNTVSDERATVARYVNDEFAVLVPGYDTQQVEALGEKIRSAVELLNIERADVPSRRVTVSVGGTVVEAHDVPAVTIDQVQRFVDAALFVARGGRDIFLGTGNSVDIRPIASRRQPPTKPQTGSVAPNRHPGNLA